MKSIVKMALIGIWVINYAAASSKESDLGISSASLTEKKTEFSASNEESVLKLPHRSFFIQDEADEATEHNNRPNKSLERFLSYFLIFSSN